VAIREASIDQDDSAKAAPDSLTLHPFQPATSGLMIT
jgi:hypothetical protein